MRTPITYYGGKQTMLKHILPLIPKHSLYTEAFVGGCSTIRQTSGGSRDHKRHQH